MVSLFELFRCRRELPVQQLPADLGHISEERWQWLVSLSFGEWNTRLWMVQEQLLNAETIMLRGPRILDWCAVAAMSILFLLDILPSSSLHRFWQSNRQAKPSDMLSIALPLFPIWVYRRRKQFQRIETSIDGHRPSKIADPLLSNMVSYQHMQCRDLRDRIFGLLAISSDTAELGVTPDYSKPANEVFLQTSIAVLQHYPDLRPLAYTCMLNNFSDPISPSWALNIPRPAQLTAVHLEADKYSPHPRILLRMRPRFHSQQSVLILKGRILDQISFCTSPFYPSPSVAYGVRDSSYIETVLELTMGILDLLSNLGITLENAAALCRVLIGASTEPFVLQEGRSSTEQAAYHFWCYFRFLINEVEAVARRLNIEVGEAVAHADELTKSLTALITSLDINSFSPRDALSSPDQSAAMEVLDYEVSKGRSICTTQQRRICSGMNAVKTGDVIATFEGADRLFVLRPVGDKYQLIGDAYVDGLMLGKAYEGVDPDEVDYDIQLV
jgi:hypothetical protein